MNDNSAYKDGQISRSEFEENARELLSTTGTAFIHSLAGDHEEILFGSGAIQDDSFDPSTDQDIMNRLAILGEPYKSEFIRIHNERKATIKPDDPLSLRQYALLELESMERTAQFMNS